MIKRLIIILWSLTLSYLSTLLIGLTNILSSIIGEKSLVPAIDLLFFAFVLIFTSLFWFFMPPKLSRLYEALGMILPLGILVYLFLFV